MRWKTTLILAVILAGATGGGYLLFSRFLKDRRAAENYQGFVDRKLPEHTTLPDGRTVTTYNAKDLAEARKKGQGQKSSQAGTPNAAAAANEAAVQRSLQTIQEINKINEMNQRLQEQQQRMQRQNK